MDMRTIIKSVKSQRSKEACLMSLTHKELKTIAKDVEAEVGKNKSDTVNNIMKITKRCGHLELRVTVDYLQYISKHKPYAPIKRY